MTQPEKSNSLSAWRIGWDPDEGARLEDLGTGDLVELYQAVQETIVSRCMDAGWKPAGVRALLDGAVRLG